MPFPPRPQIAALGAHPLALPSCRNDMFSVSSRGVAGARLSDMQPPSCPDAYARTHIGQRKGADVESHTAVWSSIAN